MFFFRIYSLIFLDHFILRISFPLVFCSHSCSQLFSPVFSVDSPCHFIFCVWLFSGNHCLYLFSPGLFCSIYIFIQIPFYLLMPLFCCYIPIITSFCEIFRFALLLRAKGRPRHYGRTWAAWAARSTRSTRTELALCPAAW